MSGGPLVSDLWTRSPLDDPAPARRAGGGVARGLLRSWEGRVGTVVAVVVLALAVAGPYVAPHGPTALNVDVPLASPSWSHPLGTDSLGRDIFSRFLSGGRTLMLVPFAAVTLAFVVGGGLGMLAAYARGWRDSAVTGLFDVLATLPPLLLVLILIAGFGTSDVVLTLTVALVFVPRIGRLVRGAAQAVVTQEYIQAAQARGERTGRILWRELLPNIAAPAIADYALRLTYAVMFVASLNYLGLGAQPPAADWGLMVAEYGSYLSTNAAAVLVPVAGIVAVSMACNLLAEALTRHLTNDFRRGIDLL